MTYVVEDNHRLSPATVVVADGVEDTIVVQLRNQLLNEENQKDTANSGKVEVVDEEKRLELEGLTVMHQLATTKDDDVVDDDKDGGRLEGRHGRLERHELEVVGGIANNELKGLVEDGPQMDAKWTVDRRQRQLLEKRRGSHFRIC